MTEQTLAAVVMPLLSGASGTHVLRIEARPWLMGCLRLSLLAVLLFTGCASYNEACRPDQDPRIAYFQRESQIIDEREIDALTKHQLQTTMRLPRRAGPSAPTGPVACRP